MSNLLFLFPMCKGLEQFHYHVLGEVEIEMFYWENTMCVINPSQSGCVICMLMELNLGAFFIVTFLAVLV